MISFLFDKFKQITVSMKREKRRRRKKRVVGSLFFLWMFRSYFFWFHCLYFINLEFNDLFRPSAFAVSMCHVIYRKWKSIVFWCCCFMKKNAIYSENFVVIFMIFLVSTILCANSRIQITLKRKELKGINNHLILCVNV